MAASSSSSIAVILYKLPEAWGLPSLSPACVQAEAYLRFTGTPFAVEACVTASKSPTGQVPALERDADVSEPSSSEYSAARAVIAFAKKHILDLDAHLTGPQRAELLAFATLIDTKLNLATTLSTWCEDAGFREFKKAAYGTRLAFPLNYILPLMQQREVRSKHADLSHEQAYEDASQALAALNDRLRSGGGPYFFGPRPCSLDALLFGHLLYYRQAPAVAPVLQAKIASLHALCEYVDHILKHDFAIAMPAARAAPTATSSSTAGGYSNQQQQHGGGADGGGASSSAEGASSSSSWSKAARGQKEPRPTPVELTPAEKAFRRNSWMWLAGVGTVLVGYILLSGRYVQFDQLGQYLEADEDDEGDDGDDGDAGDE